jgi:hypothetical protein
MTCGGNDIIRYHVLEKLEGDGLAVIFGEERLCLPKTPSLQESVPGPLM